MPGFMSGIHVLSFMKSEGVDGRDKPGHDEAELQRTAPPYRAQGKSTAGKSAA